MPDILPLAPIRLDGGTQSRAALYQNVIDDYAEAFKAGATFPPIVVFHDGADYWLADGFHRHHGAHKAGLKGIDAEVHQGTQRDAVLFSVGANASHGLRCTNDDKRRAVTMLLMDEEWQKWSDRKIAFHAAVDHKTVSALRAKLSGEIPQIRTIERKGTVYEIDTSNIGKAPAVLPSSDPTQYAAREDDIRVSEFANDNRAAYRTSFTGNNEWYTPSQHIELARRVLGRIDVDPASNPLAQATVKATAFYTIHTNGLDKEWHGTVWMNPPYSQPDIVNFIDKLVAEYDAGRTTEAIVLTNNSTDTKWFNTLFSAASAVRFTRRRIKFVSPKGEFAAPAMGQAFTYLGSRPERFVEVFSEIGNVVSVVANARNEERVAA